MNIHDAVESMIEKDMRSGFASGFFSGHWNANGPVKEAFKAHARIVAVESIALILNMNVEEAWNQYQVQNKEAK